MGENSQFFTTHSLFSCRVSVYQIMINSILLFNVKKHVILADVCDTNVSVVGK